MTFRAMLIIMVALFSSGAWAEGGYKCKPIQALWRMPDGTLGMESTAKMILSMNTEFVVDRTTGRIVGSNGFSNYNEGFGSPKVIDAGSSEQSFKALTIYSPNVSIAYLEIQEYSEGKRKPFTFVGGGLVLSGNCEHY